MKFNLTRGVVAGVMAFALVLSVVAKGGNIPPQTSLLGALDSVESSTLLCSALDAGTSPVNGVVTFTNVSDETRQLTATLSDGIHMVGATWTVAAHDSLTVRPSEYLTNTNITVRAVVDGGGVTGVIRTTVGPTSTVPCHANGTSTWSVAGLRSKNGALARIVVMNPTSTPAVINVTTWSSNGYLQIAPYQGLVVPPVGQVTLNLSNYVVEATDISVNVNALRGHIVATALQVDGRNGSLIGGQDELTTTQWYPAVPTDDAESVALNVLNPSSAPADFRVFLDVPGFTIAPLRFNVPGGSRQVVVIPNSRIPSSGLASLKVVSRLPLATSVQLTRGNFQRIMSPPPLANELSWVGSAGVPETMRLVTDANTTVVFHYFHGGTTKSVSVKATAGQALTPPAQWRQSGRGIVTSSAGMALTSVFANTAFECGLDPRQ